MSQNFYEHLEFYCIINNKFCHLPIVFSNKTFAHVLMDRGAYFKVGATLNSLFAPTAYSKKFLPGISKCFLHILFPLRRENFYPLGNFFRPNYPKFFFGPSLFCPFISVIFFTLKIFFRSLTILPLPIPPSSL